MGTNPLVQFVLQPILIFGVIFHFVMGFYLEILNAKSRKIITQNFLVVQILRGFQEI